MQELEEAEQSLIRFSQSQSFDNKLKSLNQESHDEPGYEDTPPEEKERSNKDQLPLLPRPVCRWRSATSRWPVESC